MNEPSHNPKENLESPSPCPDFDWNIFQDTAVDHSEARNKAARFMILEDINGNIYFRFADNEGRKHEHRRIHEVLWIELMLLNKDLKERVGSEALCPHNISGGYYEICDTDEETGEKLSMPYLRFFGKSLAFKSFDRNWLEVFFQTAPHNIQYQGTLFENVRVEILDY